MKKDFHLKKEGNSDPCYSMDEIESHYSERNKAVRKGHKLYDFTYEVPKGVRFIESASRSVPGRGRGLGNGSYCSIGTVDIHCIEYRCSIGIEFVFGMMKKFWRWVVMVVSQCCECG